MEVRRRMQWRTCLVLILVAVSCEAQQFLLPHQPSDLRVDSSGTVFVAAGNELFRLDSDFDQQESMELARGITIQRIALGQDGSRVVLCLDDESCTVYNASNFVAGALLTREEATTGVDEVTAFTSPNDGFYTGSYGSALGATNVIYLTQYGYGGSEFIRRVNTAYNGNAVSLSRNFYGGFIVGPNAYYIVYDGNPSDVRGIRVLRICDQEQCPGGAGSCDIDALYEAELECPSSLGSSTAICGVSLLSTFDGTSQNRLVVSLCDPLGRNRICSYNLTEIDVVMDSLYTQCSAGTGTVPQPVWIGSGSRACSGFTSENECNGFNGPAALTTSSISGTLHVDLGSSVDRLSSTLALTVEGSTLLYVGYTNRGQHFVGRYNITSTSVNLPFSDLTVVAQPTSAVRHLQWTDGLEYIYVATEGDDSDENNIIAPVVFRIAVECSTINDCQNCTGDSNLLCGWCTAESKCSRRSDCRNSSQPMRWVQEASQCITSVVNPTTFVLDNPQNITVTVIPGLPPPLDGESYECFFAAAGGTSFFTNAVEIMANTQYMCDLTGVIPDFQGVSLVIDFSFRSTAIGIPFATEEGGLTVLNRTGPQAIELTCLYSSSVPSPFDHFIPVECFTNVPYTSVFCSYDSGPIQGCPIISANATFFCFEINLYTFFGESHIAMTTVEDASGNSDQVSIPFTLPPALVPCSASTEGVSVTVECPGSDSIPGVDSLLCSLNGGGFFVCTPHFRISALHEGPHSILVLGEVAGSGSIRVGDSQFIIEGLDLYFINDTPQVDGTGGLHAQFRTNRPDVQLTCRLVGRSNRVVVFSISQECASGNITFTDLPAGDYVLRVIANDVVNGDKVVIPAGLSIRGNNDFCTITAINRRVTVFSNSATIEFGSTGAPTGFCCRLDQQQFFTCSSTVRLMDLDPGRHQLRIRPVGCGRAGIGHRSLSVNFEA